MNDVPSALSSQPSVKLRWCSHVTPELFADKPALQAWMILGIDGWAAERGYEPDGPVLGIHELGRIDCGEDWIMIEVVILRRYRKSSS